MAPATRLPAPAGDDLGRPGRANCPAARRSTDSRAARSKSASSTPATSPGRTSRSSGSRKMENKLIPLSLDLCSRRRPAQRSHAEAHEVHAASLGPGAAHQRHHAGGCDGAQQYVFCSSLVRVIAPALPIRTRDQRKDAAVVACTPLQFRDHRIHRAAQRQRLGGSCKKRNIPLMEDLGSGALFDFDPSE